MYTVIVMKIALTSHHGAGAHAERGRAFLALRRWTRALERLGIAHRSFTRQENCVVKTCAVAC